MKYLILLLIMALPAMGATRLRSPREASAVIGTDMVRVRVSPLKTETVTLNWGYPLEVPRTPIKFRVDYKPDLKNSPWQILAEVSSPPFTTTVTGGGRSAFYRVTSFQTQQVRLRWDAPVGWTPYGYEIVRGTEPGNYFSAIRTADTMAVISGVMQRTFFAAVGLDQSFVSSPFSNEVDYEPEVALPISNLTISKN